MLIEDPDPSKTTYYILLSQNGIMKLNYTNGTTEYMGELTQGNSWPLGMTLDDKTQILCIFLFPLCINCLRDLM
jgi:hypothetical protein